jgi:hypothetical protein
MDTSGMSMDPFAASSFFNKRDIHLFSHLWFVFYINRFVYVFVLFFVYSRISSVDILVNDNDILYFFKVKWEHQVLLFFVAMKRKKTKKKIRWELMSWRHVSKGSSSSSSVKTLLKMRDNPLSHASRFTAKLARLFNWKQDAHTETISKIYTVEEEETPKSSSIPSYRFHATIDDDGPRLWAYRRVLSIQPLDTTAT